MRRAVESLNADADTPGAGAGAMRFGAGIHTGEVVLGTIGIRRRAEFTAMCDAVNTAARLEALSKDVGGDLVLSAETVERLPPERFRLRELGPVPIRGKREPVAAFVLQ
jgi:adenylate cyclase